MQVKNTRLIRMATAAGVVAALLAGINPAQAESFFSAAGFPHVFVHLQDSTGAPVPGGCFMMRDEPLGEPVYAEECDGADGIFPGDGSPDGIVELDHDPAPGNYAIYTVTLPNGDQTPDHLWPRPVPFTMASSDVHVTITLPSSESSAPVLTLPDAIVVDATSAAGATVEYSVSATDGLGNPLTASCTPASGSPFPVGITEVSCGATDVAGQTTVGTFSVTVRGAGAQLDDLLGRVWGVGPGRSLYTKVLAARSALQSGDVAGACRALADFLREVNAQAGKSLTLAQAEELRVDATRIRTVIGC